MDASVVVGEVNALFDISYDEITLFIKNNPIFALCTSQELARMVPKIEKINYEAGQSLYQAGSVSDSLYLIISGSIKLYSGKRTLTELNSGLIGEEAIIGHDYYILDARAERDAQVLAIPKEAISKLLETNSGLKSAFYSSLLDHFSRGAISYQQAIQDSKAKAQGANFRKSVGWVAAILIPGLFLYIGSVLGLDWSSKIFGTVFASAIVMWVFRLCDEFIPSILALLVLVFLGIAPASVVLSGFTSGSFFMALSVFGLAVVLVSSGVTYRFVLFALKSVPRSKFGYNIIIFLTGFLLTPVFPSANGRVSITTPLLVDMVETLGYKRGGKAATQLAAASFNGLSLFSGAFVSSKAINFVVFGMLPFQVREQFSWGYWIFASTLFMLVMFALYVIAASFMYRNNEVPRLSKEQLELQLKTLGPVSNKEWIAIVGIVLFIIGIATSSIHKIETPWIGLAILYFLLSIGTLTKKEFQKEISWPFLIYLGGLIGLVESMSYIGLDQKIGSHLAFIGHYMRDNLFLFILLLSVCISLVRMAIPNNAAVVIFATIFIPIAQASGINPWVIGFIILTMSDGWFLPYQCTYYVQFLEETKKQALFDRRQFLKLNALTNIIRLVAVYASIPYWRLLGIL